jgi:L-glyceraldehyde 3-phosphate reductase
LSKVKHLGEIAKNRRQTIAQTAIAWVLRKPAVTSALIGASRVSQIVDIVNTLENTEFTDDELKKIDEIFITK